MADQIMNIVGKGIELVTGLVKTKKNKKNIK